MMIEKNKCSDAMYSGRIYPHKSVYILFGLHPSTSLFFLYLLNYNHLSIHLFITEFEGHQKYMQFVSENKRLCH